MNREQAEKLAKEIIALSSARIAIYHTTKNDDLTTNYINLLSKKITDAFLSTHNSALEVAAIISDKHGYEYPDEIETDTYDDAYEQGFDIACKSIATEIRGKKVGE